MDTCRILIVDDHPIVRSGITFLVSPEPDFEVVAEAETPAEALDAVSNNEIDLIILDLTMGGNDGLELLRQIRKISEETPILVYSMNDEITWGERAILAGAKGYIPKHREMTELLSAMRVILAGQLALGKELEARLLNRLSASNGGRRARSGIGSLTDRELQVLNLIGTGRTTGEIAAELKLSPKTIGAHREHIKTKLGLRSAAELASEAVRLVDQRTV